MTNVKKFLNGGQKSLLFFVKTYGKSKKKCKRKVIKENKSIIENKFINLFKNILFSSVLKFKNTRIGNNV